MSKIEIYYFSGTGNSLYVTRELHKRIPESKIVPIVSLLNKDVIETNAEAVGFIFPIYFTSIPEVMKNFIKKLNLESTKYTFAIATRVGISHSAFYDIDKILKTKGRGLDSYFTLNMAGNNPRFDYKAPTDEELVKLEEVVNKEVESIQNVVIDKRKYQEKDTNTTTTIPSIFLRLISLVVPLLQGAKKDNGFYADFKCIGCGTCEKVCLSGKIKIMDNKPIWQKDVKCYDCVACVNYCPERSIQMNSKTEKFERYSHPYATEDDIAAQKIESMES